MPPARPPDRVSVEPGRYRRVRGPGWGRLGKTWGLLLEPTRHVDNGQFGAVIFRRKSTEITNEGGLWDESRGIYPHLGGDPMVGRHEWRFPSGAKVRFAHLNEEDTVYDWMGAQVPLIGFDQLELFTEFQFWYMLTRNRSMCGVKPYIRATVNPDADSWVANLIAWWIDQETGYPVLERSGVIRYFARINEEVHWGDTREDLLSRFPDAYEAFRTSLPEAQQVLAPEIFAKSLTFIVATIYDNKKLLEKDPGYLGNLLAQPLVERERLLKGNWKIKPATGKLFNKAWFKIVKAAPAGGRECRFWDLAATEKKMGVKSHDPDFTASNRMRRVGDSYFILDATADRTGPAATNSLMLNMARQDGTGCAVRWELEGGASGKRDAMFLAGMLAGFDCRAVPPQGDKVMRARGLAAQAEAGNVYLVEGAWNERWLNHMHGQPELAHDDEMDAASGSFNELAMPAPDRPWAGGSREVMESYVVR